MAVYTHFGGMSGLVREVVREGFARLQRTLTQVKRTDDPVADLALMGRAYRRNAAANLHLYAIMFGGSSLPGFTLTEEDRRHGRYTLTTVVECATRCMTVGRFAVGDAELIAHQMWIAIHGLVTLELGDYLIEPSPADRCFEALLTGLMVGAGDSLAAATQSVARSKSRLGEVDSDDERREGEI
jgi:AcrR family transcriptional regulator